MNYKVYVKDKETSKKVQEHAFKLGYVWPNKEYNILESKNMLAAFLFFNKDNFISYLYEMNSNFEYFKNKDYKELTPEEFIALPIQICYNYNTNKNCTIGKCSECNYVLNKLPKEEIFDVSKMTEIEAYAIAAEMWFFLFNNPHALKSDWPEYKKYRMNTMAASCSLCTYYNFNCRRCYLFQHSACSKTVQLSTSSDTPTFWVWHHSKDSETRREAAEAIYELLHEYLMSNNDRMRWFNNEMKERYEKKEFTHEQIMTGWFRVPTTNNVGSWFRVWIYNPSDKRYGVSNASNARYLRKDFNDWEYSELPPEGELK